MVHCRIPGPCPSPTEPVASTINKGGTARNKYRRISESLEGPEPSCELNVDVSKGRGQPGFPTSNSKQEAVASYSMRLKRGSGSKPPKRFINQALAGFGSLLGRKSGLSSPARWCGRIHQKKPVVFVLLRPARTAARRFGTGLGRKSQKHLSSRKNSLSLLGRHKPLAICGMKPGRMRIPVRRLPRE